MRKAAVVGAALVCVCLMFAMSGPFAQRMVNGDGGGGSAAPVSVSVSNFPQVQPVHVGNLPLDQDGGLRVTPPPHTEMAVVVPTYFCQLTGSVLPGAVFHLNHGINFQPIGLPGVQTFISLNDDPASTGTTADCLRLADAIAAAGTSSGCVAGPTIQISESNIQLRMVCAGERNEVVQAVSSLSTAIFALHPSPAP